MALNKPIHFFFLAILAVFFCGMLLLITDGGLLTNWALDWLWRNSGPIRPKLAEEAGNQIVVIGIDNDGLRKLRGSGRRISRTIYADIINQVASLGARLIGFDVIFEDRGSIEEDETLRTAVKSFGKVVSNCFLANDEGYTKLWITGRSFFREDSIGEGFADFPLDSDKFIRRARPYAPKGDLPVRISWALALYLANVEKKKEDIKFHENFLLLPRAGDWSPIPLPLDHKGRVLIPFCETSKIATFPVLDLFEGRVPVEKIRDKIVLIGGTADEFRDSFHTPFAITGRMPGVEIHAHFLEALLSGHKMREISGPMWWGCLLLFAIPGSFIPGFFGIAKGGLLLLFLGMIWHPINFEIFQFGVFVNPFDIWAVLFLSWLAAMIVISLVLMKQRDEFSRIFKRYLSPALLDELMKHPEALSLGGARKEIVVLFADVRGFTRMCEERPPEQIISILNSYFSAVTGVIFEEGGILDKFIGDGLMAFFGVPFPKGDEPDRALSAALQMQKTISSLRKTADSPDAFPIEKIGIGINGGEVVVGNVGSELHQEYTLLGDNVNVAARLEANANEGEILISEWVKSRLSPDKFIIKPRGLLKVKGRKGEIETFEVTGFNENPPLQK